MGVQGLWQLISSTGRPVPLDSLEGKILAVDVSVWLHQLSKGMRDGSGNPVSNAHLHGLFTRICKLLHYRIKPVFVFDGGVPTLKKQTLASRRGRREDAEQASRAMQQKLLTNLIRTQALHEASGVGGRLILPQTQKSKSSKDAIYELPPLPEHSQRCLEESGGNQYIEEEQAPPMDVEEEYRDGGVDGIDVDSSDFIKLPVEIQLEIMMDLKEARKDYKKTSNIDDLPEDSKDFSSFQMQKLLKHNRLNTRLESVRKEINSQQARAMSKNFYDPEKYSGEVHARKLASDDTAHFILISGIKKNLQQKKVEEEKQKRKSAKAVAAVPVSVSEESSNNDELLNDSDGDCKVNDADFLKSTEAKAFKQNFRDGYQDNVEVGSRSSEITIKQDCSNGDKPRYRPVIEIDSDSGSEMTDEVEDIERDENGQVKQTLDIIDLEELQTNDIVTESDRDLQRAILQSLEVPKESETVRGDKAGTYFDVCSTSKVNTEGSVTLMNATEKRQGKGENLTNAKRKHMSGDRMKDNSVETGICDGRNSSTDATERSAVKQRKRSDVAKLNKNSKEITIKKAGSILTRRKSSLNDQKDLKKPEETNEKLDDERTMTSSSNIDRNKNGKSDTKSTGKSDREGRKKVTVSKDGIRRVKIESDEEEDKAREKEEEKIEMSGSDSSSEDFIEVRIDPSNIRPDTLFPASIFEGGPDNESETTTHKQELKNSPEDSEKDVGEMSLNGNAVTESESEEMDLKEKEKESESNTVKPLMNNVKKREHEDECSPAKNKRRKSMNTDESDLKHQTSEEDVSVIAETVTDESEEDAADENESEDGSNDEHETEEDMSDRDETEDIADEAETEILVPQESATVIERTTSPKVQNLVKAYESITEQTIHGMREGLVAESKQLRLEQGRQERLAMSITDQMHAEAQELLQLFGIPFIVSPTEAEAQCAQLEMSKLVHGTITDDSDIWLFGGQCVFKNFFNQQKHVECFKKDQIVSQLGLCREALINIAMLCGCDYTEGLQGVGPVTAMEILAEFPGTGVDCLTNLKKWWTRAIKELKPPLTESKLRAKLRQLDFPEGFPNKLVAEAFLNPAVDDSTEKFTWSIPDLDLLRQFASTKLSWPKPKTDEILLPVLKRLNERETQRRISSYFHPETYMQPAKMKSKRLQKVVSHFLNPEENSMASNETAENAKPNVTKTAKGRRGKKQNVAEQRSETGTAAEDEVKDVTTSKASGRKGPRGKQMFATSKLVEARASRGKRAMEEVSEDIDTRKTCKKMADEDDEESDSSYTDDSDSDSDTSSDSFTSSDSDADAIDESRVVQKGLDIGEILNLKADIRKIEKQFKATQKEGDRKDSSRVFDNKLNVDEIMNLEVCEELFEDWSDDMAENVVNEKDKEINGAATNYNLKELSKENCDSEINVKSGSVVQVDTEDFNKESNVETRAGGDTKLFDNAGIPSDPDFEHDVVLEAAPKEEKKIGRASRSKALEKDHSNTNKSVDKPVKRKNKLQGDKRKNRTTETDEIQAVNKSDKLTGSEEADTHEIHKTSTDHATELISCTDNSKVTDEVPHKMGSKDSKHVKDSLEKKVQKPSISCDGLGHIKRTATGVPWADKTKGRKRVTKGKGSEIARKVEPRENLTRMKRGETKKKQLIGCVNLSESDSD